MLSSVFLVFMLLSHLLFISWVTANMNIVFHDISFDIGVERLQNCCVESMCHNIC